MSIDLEIIRAAVAKGRAAGLVSDPEPKPRKPAAPRRAYWPMMERVLRRVAGLTGFSVDDLRAAPANATTLDPVAFARQLACAAAKSAGIPDSEIARYIRRTRAMVHYSVHRISGKWRADAGFRETWRELTGTTEDPANLYTPKKRNK